MNRVFTNIHRIFQYYGEQVPSKIKGEQLYSVPAIEGNFWMLVIEGRIVEIADMQQALPSLPNIEINDLKGASIAPTYVDCHTHLVFAGTRENEFQWRLQGKSYEQIAAEGGGILNSAARLAQTDEETLYEQAVERLHTIAALGTGALEMKSGYGLSVEAELKILRVMRKLQIAFPEIPMRTTFLGAHAFPKSHSRAEYLSLILEEMLPKVAQERLAQYNDVFCDRGFFTPEETAQVFEKAQSLGLKNRIHANELGHTGGVEVAIKYNCLSADHLEHLNEDEIENLKMSTVMPVFLPGTSFFLGIPYGPAQQLIEEDMAFALASDYNPGSCPSGNMNLLMSIAATQMKLPIEVSFNAATINAAYALEMEHEIGYIGIGKLASFQVMDGSGTLAFIPYNFGAYKPKAVYFSGKELKEIFASR